MTVCCAKDPEKGRRAQWKLVVEMVRYPGGYLRPRRRDAGLLSGDEAVEHYEEPGSFEETYFAHHLHGEQ